MTILTNTLCNIKSNRLSKSNLFSSLPGKQFAQTIEFRSITRKRFIRPCIALLVVLLFGTAKAQDTNEIYCRLNYTFVPHNLLNGVGYSVGYHWNTDQPVSYKAEMGMMTTYRERKMNDVVGDIRYLDLYYNLAQLNLAFIPTLRLAETQQWLLTSGLGVSGAYQSKLFTESHYDYKNRNTYGGWEEAMTMNASNRLHAGLIGAIDLSYKLPRNRTLNLSATYQLYYQGESVAGVGIGLGF